MMTQYVLKSKAPLPTLLKMKEVAQMLAISRASVQGLIECGDLEASDISPTRKKPKRVHRRVTTASLAAFYKKRFGRDLETTLQNPHHS